jgi:DNA-binding NtrC family response regulator
VNAQPLEVRKYPSDAPETSRPHTIEAPESDRRPLANSREPDHFASMVGSSSGMRLVFDQIARAAPTDASVLILGETGTGKDLVAEALHTLSRRCAGPLISINCGAIPASLIESELFGHERGSFTGADRAHRGHFERADGGTIFLDEICEMRTDVQVKLLRVLESGTFFRVGGSCSVKVNVRVVSASKPDLKRAVASGRFRADLLYRLRVLPIVLPPLRERSSDLTLLIEYFLAALNEAEGCAKKLTPAASERLHAHDWPGNVRELKHTLEGAFILSGREIGLESLAVLGAWAAPAKPATASSEPGITLRTGMSLADAARRYVIATLDCVDGSQVKAAAMLKISSKTLRARLREARALSPPTAH